MNSEKSCKAPCRYTFFSVFLISFCLFSLGVIGVEITRIDVRFALFVEDMTLNGMTVFPTINGVPYADYPVTMTLIAWLFSGKGAFLNQWTLALGSILCGSLTIAMTYLTGEKIRRGAGIAAAALSFMTLEYMTSIMGFGIDVPVAAAGSVMLYLLVASPRSCRVPAVFALLLVICFLVRGPLGLLLLGAAVGGWLLFRREWEKMIFWGLTGAVTACLCAFLGLKLIYASGGEELYQTFLSWQITSRMAADDLFFYVLDGPAVFSPCTLFGILAIGIAIWKKRLLHSPLMGLIGFFLLPLILLSIPGCKHLRYMLITIPAFAIAGGLGIQNSFSVPLWNRILRTIFFWLGRFVWAAAMLAAILMVVISSCMMHSFEEWRIRIFAVLLFPAVWRILCRKTGLMRDILRTGLPLAILFTVFVFPVMSVRERAMSFVKQAETYRTGRLYFYRIGCDHEDLKYLMCIPPEQRKSASYLYSSVQKQNKYSSMYRILPMSELSGIQPGDLLILQSKQWENLQKDARNAGKKAVLHYQGQLGHREYAAVELLPGSLSVKITE